MLIMNFVITSAIFFHTLACVFGAECFKMSGCQDPKRDVAYKENAQFAVVDDKGVSCAICTCVKNTHYAGSCMEVQVVDMPTSVRKANLKARKSDDLEEMMSADFGKEEEIEITEQEAEALECEPEAMPDYDEDTQILQFKFINYFFVTWESVCCQKTPNYGNRHHYCMVKFNGKCRPKAVMRDRPNQRCNMPLPRLLQR